jgi:hypothetical protein
VANGRSADARLTWFIRFATTVAHTDRQHALGYLYMAAAPRLELQELVDSPNETLEVEYKGWLNLADNICRADVARHIAALANHGGGRIVFGFTDDMTYAGLNPTSSPAIDHDCISGIVKKYLEPPFQCDVDVVVSKAGNAHPVVTVPPHGATPVCAKANGPELNGRPAGIVHGTYYVRKPGPESAPVLTANEWGPLIRRCAVHDRTAILGAIQAVLNAPASSASTTTDQLRSWHDAARLAFLRDLKAVGNYPPIYEKAHVQLSYRIITSEDERLTGTELIAALREVNNEVRDLVRTGWSMFFIFDRTGIQPVWAVDPASGEGELDFLECSLLRDPRLDWTGCDLWRVTTGGKAALVREYWEDEADWCKARRIEPGTGFDPNLMLRSVSELVRHARGLAGRLGFATDVEFRCEWHGLAGRVLVNERGGVWSPRQPPIDALRVATANSPVASLDSDWPAVVSRLASPVARLFDIEQFATPDAILKRSKSWNSL